MNGMLRDLLSERADAAGPQTSTFRTSLPRRKRVTRRRRVVVGGTAAAVVLTVGASFALSQRGDRTTSPDLATDHDPPTTSTSSPTHRNDGTQPLTYGVGGTIHYGDRVIEAAEDPDGLYVFDDGLWFFTGENEGTSTTHLYYTDGELQPVEIARGIDRVTPGEVGSLLVWLDGDDVVIYDTHVRDVVARVPLNGKRLGNPIIPLEDAVHWREYDDSAESISDGRSVRYDMSAGTRTRVSRADERAAEARAAGPPRLVVGSADSTDSAEDFTVAAQGSRSTPADEARRRRSSSQRRAASARHRPRRVRRRVAGRVPVAGRRPVRDGGSRDRRHRKGTDRRPARVPHLRRPVPHSRLRPAGLAAARRPRRRRRGGLTCSRSAWP